MDYKILVQNYYTPAFVILNSYSYNYDLLKSHINLFTNKNLMAFKNTSYLTILEFLASFESFSTFSITIEQIEDFQKVIQQLLLHQDS